VGSPSASRRPVRFGVTLPQIKRSWAEARDAAIEFDRLGFDSVWVCDHLHGVPLPSLPILEAWTELAAIAAVTERVGLGTLVTPPFFRNPAVLAKQIATLDQISNGRAIAGLGTGWFDAEFKGYGLPFPPVRERLRALEETIAILRLLWSEEKVSYEGRVFKLENAYCEPKPVKPPPILVGGGGEKVLLRIAAQHADIWNNMAATQTELPRKIEVLRQRCAEVGRDPESVEISQQCLVVIAATADEARQALAKAAKIYGGHMGTGDDANGLWGTPENVAERLRRRVELGCTLFVIEFFGRDTRMPARLFAESVIPAFR
jgi:F420-dependent oxidoreductase-like protein